MQILTQLDNLEPLFSGNATVARRTKQLEESHLYLLTKPEKSIEQVPLLFFSIFSPFFLSPNLFFFSLSLSVSLSLCLPFILSFCFCLSLSLFLTHSFTHSVSLSHSGCVFRALLFFFLTRFGSHQSLSLSLSLFLNAYKFIKRNLIELAGNLDWSIVSTKFRWITIIRIAVRTEHSAMSAPYFCTFEIKIIEWRCGNKRSSNKTNSIRFKQPHQFNQINIKRLGCNKN